MRERKLKGDTREKKNKKKQDASVGAVIRTDNGLEKNKKKKSATEVEPNVYRKFI